MPPNEACGVRWLPWTLGCLGILIAGATAALAIANRSAMHSLDQADPVEIILPLGYATIGALLASRNPQNPIGWIFLGIAIFTGLPGIATQYVFRNWHFHRLPAADWVAWKHDWMVWIVFPPGLATLFFLPFPDGHLPSGRWRWLPGPRCSSRSSGSVSSYWRSRSDSRGRR